VRRRTHHLILEILRRHQWINQIPAPLSLISYDLSTCPADVRVNVKGFPEMVDGRWARTRANIEEDADIWLQDWAEGVEEPAVGVYLGVVLESIS
jgi:hypothetical protein